MNKTNNVKIYVKNKNKMKKIMAERYFNNTKLANDKRVGITRQYLSNILNGHSVGSVTAGNIAQTLGVKFEDIFFATDVDKSFTKQKEGVS